MLIAHYKIHCRETGIPQILTPFSAKTQHLARQRPNKVRVPPKLYPIKKANYAQPTSNPAEQGMANGGFGVIISVE